MNIDGALSIATGGLANISRRMALISQNVANASTPGYSAEIAEFPEERRRLELHRSHLVEMTELDQRFVTERVVRQGTMTGTPSEMRDTLKGFESTGAALFVYSPFGPDIPRELEAFAKVAGI